MKEKIMEGICKYCNQYKKLCKAHIIPKAFYNIEETPYIGLSKNGIVDCKYSQNGLKDDNILCSECDAILGNYDKYGAEILKNKACKNLIAENKNNERLYKLTKDAFDYTKLRKFFISVVWRASISKLCNVSLGKYEDTALKIIKNEIKDDSNLFYPLIIHRPKDYKLKDIAYISEKRILNQKAILIAFPDYQISVITNCRPINNSNLLKLFLMNSEQLLVAETTQDVNETVFSLSYIINQIKNKNGGSLPNLYIK